MPRWPVTGQGFQNTNDRQSSILSKSHKSEKSQLILIIIFRLRKVKQNVLRKKDCRSCRSFSVLACEQERASEGPRKAPRSRVLARLALLAQKGELARRLLVF